MSANHTYSVTEGRIQLPRKFGKVLTLGDRVHHNDLVHALGLGEVQRLIRQGWLKVDGLRPGLELGTIVPTHEPLPTEVTYADHKGEKVAEVKHGPDNVARSTPASVQVGSGDVVDLSKPDAPEQGKDTVAAEPSAVKDPTLNAPAVPAGIWNANPETLQGMPVASLNALVADKGGDVRFEEGQEAGAVAYLSQDYKPGSDAPAAPQGAEGDASAESTTHAVQQAGGARLGGLLKTEG